MRPSSVETSDPACTKRKMLSMNSSTSWFISSRKYSAMVSADRPTRSRTPGGSSIWPNTKAVLEMTPDSVISTSRSLPSRVRSPTPANTDTPLCSSATPSIISWMITVLPTPAPPNMPILPPATYGSSRSITLMPVWNISVFGSSWSKAGAWRWIGQRSSPPSKPGSSSALPSTLKTCPRVFSPTGTVIGTPVLVTAAPLTRPSVGDMAIARTVESPTCWATSQVMVLVSSPSVRSTVSAYWISGMSSGANSTSTTGPITRAIRPVPRLPFELSAIGQCSFRKRQAISTKEVPGPPRRTAGPPAPMIQAAPTVLPRQGLVRGLGRGLFGGDRCGVEIRVVEVEQTEQVAHGRAVHRHVGIAGSGLRVGQVVEAAGRQRVQAPVALDKLEDRGVVGVGVVDRALLGVGGGDQHGDPGAVAEEAGRLDVAGVVVAAALVGGHEDRRGGIQLRMRHELVEDVGGEPLEQRPGRGRRMPVEDEARLDVGDRRQGVLRHVVLEIGQVLQVAPLRRGHDRSGVLERVADGAVGGARVAGDGLVVVLAEVAPGDPLARQLIPDGREGLRRDCERAGGVQGAVGVVARRVVVEQVVGAWRAVGFGVVGAQVVQDRADSGLARVRAVGEAPARVAVLGEVVVGARLGVGVLDLVARRDHRAAIGGLLVGRVSGAGHDRVGPGAAHHRLVVVVGHGEAVGELLGQRRVAGLDVVVAHLEAALVDRGVRDGAVVVAGGVGRPDEQVVLALIDLLPHLIEAVDRVAGVGGVRDVLGDLVRLVGQVGREARVRYVLRQPDGVGRG